MSSFTLKNIKRDKSQNNLYDLFSQTYIDNNTEQKFLTFVTEDENMRLDLVSKRIYGSNGYIEELMQLNNIINIWNIKKGDTIYYLKINVISILKKLELELDNIAETLSKPNKNTRIDPDRIVKVPPTIKPKSLETIILDTKNNKIKINNRLS